MSDVYEVVDRTAIDLASAFARHHGPRSRRFCRCSVGRYYDPATGQFLSVDPLVDQTGQPYAYTGDNPVNAVDPSGDGPAKGVACILLVAGSYVQTICYPKVGQGTDNRGPDILLPVAGKPRKGPVVIVPVKKASLPFVGLYGGALGRTLLSGGPVSILSPLVASLASEVCQVPVPLV